MDWKAIVSGAIALPNIAAVLLWLTTFCAPDLAELDELMPLYGIVAVMSLLALIAVVIWLWFVEASWHATMALAAAWVALVFHYWGLIYWMPRHATF